MGEMSDVSVIVASYGDESWIDRGRQAVASARAQTVPVEVVHHHGRALHEARNSGAADANGRWLVFLDADDELDAGYVEAMLAAAGQAPATNPWLFQPATLGVVDGVEDDAPVVIPPRPLSQANYLVVGTMVSAEQFWRVGGFADLACLEDWDLWIRCFLDGARVRSVPQAIYRVHVRRDSRNLNARVHGQVYLDITRRYRDRVHQLGGGT